MRLLTILSTALPLAGCVSGYGLPRCFPHYGDCIAVTVNSQPSVRLGKTARSALEPLAGAYPDVNSARYELAQPLRGEIDVQAVPVEGKEAVFGPLARVDVTIIPLQPIQVETRSELRTDPSVRVGGQALVTHAEVLTDNRLPPGRYLLSVTLRGRLHWNRQTIYAVVDE